MEGQKYRHCKKERERKEATWSQMILGDCSLCVHSAFFFMCFGSLLNYNSGLYPGKPTGLISEHIQA